MDCITSRDFAALQIIEVSIDSEYSAFELFCPAGVFNGNRLHKKSNQLKISSPKSISKMKPRDLINLDFQQGLTPDLQTSEQPKEAWETELVFLEQLAELESDNKCI